MPDATFPVPGHAPLLSPSEIAEAVGLSRTVIYRAIEEGDLPAVKIRGRLRVEASDFTAWKSRDPVRPRASRAPESPMLDPPEPAARPALRSGSFRRRVEAMDRGHDGA